MSYSARREEVDVDRAAAAFDGNILKGAKAAELPVQQPTTSRRVVETVGRKAAAGGVAQKSDGGPKP